MEVVTADFLHHQLWLALKVHEGIQHLYPFFLVDRDVEAQFVILLRCLVKLGRVVG
jgi:hypothetical protein